MKVRGGLKIKWNFSLFGGVGGQHFSTSMVFFNKEGFNKKLIEFSIKGWVGQERVKFYFKKHAFKIHFRPFYAILDQLFFPCSGGWASPSAVLHCVEQ